ncbi:MAG TPA: YicC/YloC family endoribonuclease [Vicinamibacterales bacterium]|nr:YicC/YloC family endoribonuclease [Vicinamibacterales bacterium]
MTGFAAVSREDEGERVNITVKSVNHRFLDSQIKAPQALAPIESRIKGLLQRKLTRGRVELALNVEQTSLPAREVVLDERLLDQVSSAVDAARERGVITGGLTASDMLRIPQVMEIRARQDPAGVSERLGALVESVLEDALDALVVMRATEGRFLEADLRTRMATIAAFVGELERLAREGQAALGDRLRERLALLPADLAGDPTAVAQEIVRFVSRSDVDEEIARMRGHLEHWESLSTGPEPCGRKLDFLLQEMNREINTIGSKVDGLRATETVIAAKAELERLREQVQNVE